MKRTPWIIERIGMKREWEPIARSASEVDASIVSRALADYLGTARYTKTGCTGSVQDYRKEVVKR